MPYFNEHLGIITPSERLSPHGIGLQREITGLFAQYNKTITGYRVNKSIMWAHEDLTATILDYCIDVKNELMFVVAQSYVKCLSLKTGNQLWKVVVNGMLKVACAPKSQFLFLVANNVIYKYDYHFNWLNQVALNNPPGSVHVDETNGFVIVTMAEASSGSTYRIKKLNLALDVIYTHSSSNEFRRTAISRDRQYLYGLIYETVYKFDLNNQTYTPINLTANWLPNVIDDDGFIYAASYSVNTKLMQLSKYDLINKKRIYLSTVLRNTHTALISYAYMTQDIYNVYVAVNNYGRNNVGILNEIYVLDKETGSLVDTIKLNPDIYVADNYMKIFHTYEYLR